MKKPEDLHPTVHLWELEPRQLEERIKYLEEMVEWLTLNITPPDKREYASPYDPAGLAKQVKKVRGE